MIRFTLLLVTLTCFECISGGVIGEDPSACEPLFGIPKRFQIPKRTCARDEKRFGINRMILKEKYMREIGGGLDDRTREDLNDFLTQLSDSDPEFFVVNGIICTICTTSVKVVRRMYMGNMTTEGILETARNVCIEYNIMHKDICEGAMEVMGETALKIVQESPLDPMSFCSLLFNGLCFPNVADSLHWDVRLPTKPKPPLIDHVEKPGKPRIKVLHLSDTHWDMKYTLGTPSECKAPLCCREGFEGTGEEKAGKWGGWMCDLPEATFDSFLEHVKKEHNDVSYVIWTGDIPAHDLWDQDVPKNLHVLDRTVKKLKEALPNVTIFPALGNHESVPPNLYPTRNQTEGGGLSWLYSKVNEEWKAWLPENSSETIMRGGFYTVLARPGLRIVSMNMNYCYSMNWWLLMEAFDPESELKWLMDVLEKAEEKGEKVHIIGHIPAGHTDCVKAWQTNFYKITNRFENTVVAQFYGHTHFDEIELFYDVKNKHRAFGVGYIGPSLTTYVNLNPGYRVYYIDGDYEGSTRFVLDYETWAMDLKKSNEEGVAKWFKLYSAKEAYNMTSLFPKDWHKFYQRLGEETEVMDLYLKHYWRDSPRQQPCNDECRKEKLCDIRSCVQYDQPFPPLST